MILDTNSTQLLINFGIIAGFVWHTAKKDEEVDKKISKACERIEFKLQELNIKLTQANMEIKEIPKMMDLREELLRNEVEQGQSKDDRRIKKIHDIIKAIEKALQDRQIYVNTERKTLY